MKKIKDLFIMKIFVKPDTWTGSAASSPVQSAGCGSKREKNHLLSISNLKYDIDRKKFISGKFYLHTASTTILTLLETASLPSNT
jgi:hypothetical protein